MTSIGKDGEIFSASAQGEFQSSPNAPRTGCLRGPAGF